MASSFFNRVVQKIGFLGRPRDAGAARVHVAVFGKHPAWDDHIPEIGLTQPPLIDFKRWLYDGIARNVDNGEWDKLERAGQLLPFGHTLLWVNAGACVAARCWQSRDGKGRDRYPMVAAAQCGDLPFARVVREAVAALRSIQDRSVAMSTVDDVQALVHSVEAALRQAIPAHGSGPHAAAVPMADRPDAEAILSIADRPELGPGRVGLLRVLYQIERDLTPGDSSSTRGFGRSGAPRAVGLRTPPCAQTPPQAAEAWLRFLLAYRALHAPLLACAPDHGRWVDLIIGIPGPSQLFALRAPEDVVPFTTDVPYTLDPSFVRGVEHSLHGLRRDGAAMHTPEPVPLISSIPVKPAP